MVEGKPVSKQEAIDCLTGRKENFIIKPTHDSTQGQNVKCINPQKDNVANVISKYGDDYIVQEVVKQSEKTAVFHRDSLNTFRISTLNVNGKVSLCNILFRCGRNGNSVDNGGAGGLMCGVMPDGHFKKTAYDKYYKTYTETDDGVRFEECYILEIPVMVELVKKWHGERLPHVGFAGWDIALDENNIPVMIEVNLRWPGIQFEQLCSETPLFGERTQEVIEYTERHPLSLLDVCSI